MLFNYLLAALQFLAMLHILKQRRFMPAPQPRARWPDAVLPANQKT